MKEYEIFKSDGGYRICLVLWGDNPVISDCPWYPTKREAEVEAKKAKFRNDTRNLRVFLCEGDWTAQIEDNYYAYDSEKEAKDRIVKEMEKLGYDKKYIFCQRKNLK